MSEKPKDGGPAFPVSTFVSIDGQSVSHPDHTGMSLRAWFAGMALQAMLACETSQQQMELAVREQHAEKPEEDRRVIMRRIWAKRAVLQADALLAELAKQD